MIEAGPPPLLLPPTPDAAPLPETVIAPQEFPRAVRDIGDRLRGVDENAQQISSEELATVAERLIAQAEVVPRDPSNPGGETDTRYVGDIKYDENGVAMIGNTGKPKRYAVSQRDARAIVAAYRASRTPEATSDDWHAAAVQSMATDANPETSRTPSVKEAEQIVKQHEEHYGYTAERAAEARAVAQAQAIAEAEAKKLAAAAAEAQKTTEAEDKISTPDGKQVTIATVVEAIVNHKNVDRDRLETTLLSMSPHQISTVVESLAVAKAAEILDTYNTDTTTDIEDLTQQLDLLLGTSFPEGLSNDLRGVQTRANRAAGEEILDSLPDAVFTTYATESTLPRFRDYRELIATLPELHELSREEAVFRLGATAVSEAQVGVLVDA